MGVQQETGAQGSSHLGRICVLGKWNIDVQDALLQKRRTDAEEHHHKQIWTKDPYGGPYEKVC